MGHSSITEAALNKCGCLQSLTFIYGSKPAVDVQSLVSVTFSDWYGWGVSSKKKISQGKGGGKEYMMQPICGLSWSMDGVVSSVDNRTYFSEQFTRLMEGVFYALIHRSI